MKSLKRLVSLLMCFAMLFGCVLVHADEAAEAEAVVYGVEENALITALGIAEYTEKDLADPITRGEFYMLLCKANAYPETVTGETLFSDLTVGADYETWTKTLYKVGIITTTRDGKVNVGDNITGMEAISLVMRTLGYGPRADALGGYPTGYLSVANQADVSDGIEEITGVELTKGMAVELLYNALHADMMVQSIGTGESEYKVSRDTNLLNTAFGIEKVEGVVDVDISRVIGVNDVNPFHIEVDGFQLESRAIENPYDYLGYHVEAYYTNKRFDEPKVIYMEKTDLNEEHVIDVEDIEKLSGNSVRAYSEEKGKYVDYDYIKGVSVIVNGTATKQAFTPDLYKGYHGSIKLLDNTGDDNADVVFVNVYENIIVGHYDSKVKAIYDKYDNSRKLVFDNTTNSPYVIIYDATGKEVQPSALTKDAVVSVYHAPEDAYQKYIRAYVSTSVVKGEIDAIEDGEEVVVAGNSYEIIDGVNDRIESILKPGTAVVLYLDVNGEVADGVIDVASESAYAYLVGAGTDGSSLDTTLVFKLFTLNGMFVDYYGAKNIRVDGVRYQSTDVNLFANLYTAAEVMTGAVLPETSLTGKAKYAYYQDVKAPISSIVKYTINSNSEIVAIDTIMNDATTVADRNSSHTNNNSLFAVKQNNVYYRAYSNHRTIGPKVAIDVNTNMFYFPVPTEDDKDIVYDEDEYNVGKFSSLVAHNKLFTNDVWAFYESDKQLISPLVASELKMGSGGAIAEGTKLALVQGLCRMLDPVKGEMEVTGLTLLAASGIVKVPVKDTFEFAGAAVATLKDADGKDVLNDKSQKINVNLEGYTGYTDDDGKFISGKIKAKHLKVGDVIRYAVDNTGYISSIEFWQRPGFETIHANDEVFWQSVVDGPVETSSDVGAYYNGNAKASTGNYSHTTAIRRAYVYQTFNEGFYAYFSDEFTGDREKDLAILATKTIDDCEFVYYTVTNLTSYRYDPNEMESFMVSNITGADVKSYLDTGDDASFVIIYTWNGQPTSIVDMVAKN